MPIFSKPKSASLNPDKLPNKKVYERDKKRVKSGTPSATSKVDADTFTSLGIALEEVKNDLIRLEDAISTFDEVDVSKLEFGNFLNIVSKASKLLAKVQSSNITTTQQTELQDYSNKIGALFNNLDQVNNQNTQELKDNYQGIRVVTPRESELQQIVKFLNNILRPLTQLLVLLNSKLVTSGNDMNRNVPPEISGINAPVEPTNVVEGAGFKTLYRLEKGAVQYQNQKYI
jgi:hypothetical protein